MILVEPSVWIDHLRRGVPELVERLQHNVVLGHPAVIGEVALGHLSGRAEILRLLSALPPAQVATPAEVMVLIEDQRLSGQGIGWVDAQLLAATFLTVGATLWTRDNRLSVVAERLRCVHTQDQ